MNVRKIFEDSTRSLSGEESEWVFECIRILCLSLRMIYLGCSREHLAKRERRGWGSGVTQCDPAQPGVSDALT